MRAFLVSACLATSVSFADAVWTFPFTELGADWTADPSWTLDPTGGHYGSPPAGGVDWVYRTLSSGPMSFPDGLDSIRVEMWSGYDYSGYAMDGGSDISIEASLDTGPGAVAFIDIEDGYEGWNYGSYGESDSSIVSVSIPTGPGQPLTLSFEGGVNTYGEWYDVELYWTLWDMTITGYGEYEGLASRTWAQIKSCL